MPIVAVVGALGAAAFAAADVAAVGLTVATAFEITAAVGATIGAIGQVTGNKTLSMVGLGIGAVGGIGALASAAGVFGAASSSSLFGSAPAASTAADTAASSGPAFGGVASDASSAATYGATSGFNAANEAGMSAADAASSGTIEFAANGGLDSTGLGTPPPSSDIVSLNTTSENAAAPAAAADPIKPLAGGVDAGKGLINNAASPDVTAATSPTLSDTGADLINPPPAPPNNLGTTDPLNGSNVTASVDPTTGKIETIPDSTNKGILGSILKFANDNKTVTLGALQAGGSLLSGLTNEMTPAQIAYYNANAANNQASAALTNRQVANLSQPKSVASLAPVTGAPTPLIPGIINNAPKFAQVTGAPA